MQEDKQENLDEMYLAVQRAGENLVFQGNQLQAAQNRFQAAKEEVQNKASELTGAARLLGWDSYHWDGSHVKQGPVQLGPEFATMSEQEEKVSDTRPS